MVSDPAPLRVVFFGTPAFAVPTLNALLSSRHQVVGVVTQPDRPKGRGQHLTPSPVKEIAAARRLSVLQPERLRDDAFLQALSQLRPDIGVVAAYGKILTPTVLAIPPRGLINVHASLLPKYRGAAPIHRAVIAGETETGVTIMRVVQALDAGPMLDRVARAIGTEETSEDVERHLAALGAAALVAALDRMSGGRVDETAQDEPAATYAPKLQKSDGIVDWSAPATAIHNQIRGLHPWPHAYSDLDGQRCLLLESRAELQGAGRVSLPGTVIDAAGDALRVATGDGVLRILRLQLQGRRPLFAREFLSGHALVPGIARFVQSLAPP